MYHVPSIRVRFRNLICDQIAAVTHKYTNSLTKMWSQIYDEELTRSNLSKLVDHIDTFYNEILEETVSRKERISEKIAGMPFAFCLFSTVSNLEASNMLTCVFVDVDGRSAKRNIFIYNYVD